MIKTEWRLKGADVWGRALEEGGAEMIGVVMVENAGEYVAHVCNDSDARAMLIELNEGNVPSFQRYHWHPVEGSSFSVEAAMRKFMGRFFDQLSEQGHFQWYTGQYSWRPAELAPELAIEEGADRYAGDDDSFAARRRRAQGRRRLEQAEREAIEKSQTSSAMNMLTHTDEAQTTQAVLDKLPPLRPGATLLYTGDRWDQKWWMAWVDVTHKWVDEERVRFYGVFAKWGNRRNHGGVPKLLGRFEDVKDAQADMADRIRRKIKHDGYKEL